MDAGLPLAMALTAAKAFEAECELAVLEVLETRRAKERARQAKHRAKHQAKDNASHALSRDKTLDAVVERDLTGEPARVVTPSLSSLPSEVQKELKPPVKPNGLTAPKGAETARGSRLPDDWLPVANYVASDFGLSHEQHADELAKFLDYWRSVPGAKGRKTDWPATWRNWMRRASQNLQTRKAHGPDAKLADRHANYARAWEGSERAAGSRWEP